jgi:hypothetical protein
MFNSSATRAAPPTDPVTNQNARLIQKPGRPSPKIHLRPRSRRSFHQTPRLNTPEPGRYHRRQRFPSHRPVHKARADAQPRPTRAHSPAPPIRCGWKTPRRSRERRFYAHPHTASTGFSAAIAAAPCWSGRGKEPIVVIARFPNFRNNILGSAWLWADCVYGLPRQRPAPRRPLAPLRASAQRSIRRSFNG